MCAIHCWTSNWVPMRGSDRRLSGNEIRTVDDSSGSGRDSRSRLAALPRRCALELSVRPTAATRRCRQPVKLGRQLHSGTCRTPYSCNSAQVDDRGVTLSPPGCRFLGNAAFGSSVQRQAATYLPSGRRHSPFPRHLLRSKSSSLFEPKPLRSARSVCSRGWAGLSGSS